MSASAITQDLKLNVYKTVVLLSSVQYMVSKPGSYTSATSNIPTLPFLKCVGATLLQTLRHQECQSLWHWNIVLDRPFIENEYYRLSKTLRNWRVPQKNTAVLWKWTSSHAVSKKAADRHFCTVTFPRRPPLLNQFIDSVWRRGGGNAVNMAPPITFLYSL